MKHSLKIFFLCSIFFCDLFSFQKLYADRVVESQKLVASLYNDLIATSMKEMSIDEKSWREANTDQRTLFLRAFKKYVSNKYGRQFSEFKGTTLEIIKSRDTLTKAGVLVSSVVVVPGNPSLKVVWQVSDGSGKVKLIDLRVEGISMLSTERQEFRSKLKKFDGSLDDLIFDISQH